ncbi:MAG: sarcosine oxidase subunit delta [Hyphomicrobiales bacterium]
MIIKCPLCGERPLEEFTMLGDANLKRPESNDPGSMDEWFAYVYERDNPRGRLSEYWHHGGGCRSWLIVERNTATHEVYAVSLASERKAKAKKKPTAKLRGRKS